MSDWIGNTQNVMATLNASCFATRSRADNDFYATPPKAVEQLLELEHLAPTIWECACGVGHISNVLTAHGHVVKSTDLIDRGFGIGGVDFLKQTEPFSGDIVTNPPFKYATEFVEKSMELVSDGNKVVFLLRIQFLEGVRRRKMFERYPPSRIYVASRTIRCALNGDFAHATGNASTYAWFVWVKGNQIKPTVGWFN